jgi:lipopolysaccharide transport system ATP-binding protein
MDNDILIRVDNVSKKYCKSLRQSMLYGMQDICRNTLGLGSRSETLRNQEFWAVDNIAFDVKRGETLGLIGPNGSGKTTLLKMLNGIFWPDRGKITVNGRVGALIEVGAGFHPSLSGRENIFVNAAILGMSRREVEDSFDSIVDFADIGAFIDAPVKHYSSGMYVRLGFAVAIHCQPDILLIDEVLAVGDKDFQIKCYRKMHEIKKSGTTIILVSHNEYTIREQTEKCVYLSQGKLQYYGHSEEAINTYLRDQYERRGREMAAREAVAINRTDERAFLISVTFFDGQGKEVSQIESGQPLTIVLRCCIKSPLVKPIFGVNFYDNNGFMYCANSDYEAVPITRGLTGDVTVKISIPQFHLPHNSYLCSAVLADENPDNLVDWHDMKYRLIVGRAHNARGAIKLPTHWEIS